MHNYDYDTIQQTADFIRSKIGNLKILDALILGSGLGALGDTLENSTVIPYSDIPAWPTSEVTGHAGNLVIGLLEGVPVVVMQGRAHFYEGWTPAEVTFPVRVFAALGMKRLLVTNSAGGINVDYKPGDLMVITDHINLTGYNPLVGKNDERIGPRFPDMSQAYKKKLREILLEVGQQRNIELRQGVYVGLSGPTYETPAEIRMLAILGADAVGMSTVPEVIVANHAGLEVVGISCISNLAAGISEFPLTHEEVKATADSIREVFIDLVRHYIRALGNL